MSRLGLERIDVCVGQLLPRLDLRRHVVQRHGHRYFSFTIVLSSSPPARCAASVVTRRAGHSRV